MEDTDLFDPSANVISMAGVVICASMSASVLPNWLSIFSRANSWKYLSAMVLLALTNEDTIPCL